MEVGVWVGLGVEVGTVGVALGISVAVGLAVGVSVVAGLAVEVFVGLGVTMVVGERINPNNEQQQSVIAAIGIARSMNFCFPIIELFLAGAAA